MPFPLKFKALLEKTENDVKPFNEVWITWAVCGCETDSCGWEGWILEAVLQREGKERFVRPSDSDQKCPRCGKGMFGTAASVKMKRDEDQAPEMLPGVDYEVGAMKYDES